MKPKQIVSAGEASQIAVEAYVFGYPLVLMDVTRRVMTAVPKAGASKSPINQFLHIREFPDYTMTDVVSPNADTLYSTAWLDLAKEPMILSLPDVGKRYYLMEMLDAWTNVFASPGSRTTGNGRGDFAIVGPQWKGKLPAGVKEIKSTTNMVWLLGRTQTNGKEDYAAVRAIQDQYKLIPLSAWGNDYTPPDNAPVAAGIDVKTPPVEQVAKMDAATFFARLNNLMKDNPPADVDASAVSSFAAIGVAPGTSFDLRSLDRAIARSVEGSVKTAQSKIAAEAGKPHGKKVNDWDVMTNLGRYGTDYLFRSIVALVGLGANLPEDAIYPRATEDTEGQPLNGANRYAVHFPKGQLPPVNAFWSLTMYNSKQFFAQNPINRYAIGDRDKLKFNDDGSLTIYIQHESPGEDKESNWLPAPKDSFNVFMRLYWPKKEIVDGVWKMPGVERVK
ncbi:MAG TPA: DUF1254 domain-containing protein [Blastocatellia bacterium]|nr:DUF1254 domain-containing protein [Blastocatellia bacterium]